MAWSELRLVGLQRSSVDAVSRALFEAGATGLHEDHLPGHAPAPRQPWDTGPAPAPAPRMVLRAYFEGERPTLNLPEHNAELHWVAVTEEDWSNTWKDGFEPVVVTPDLTISPPWCAPEGALIIEPGQGFGTGHHPTTVQALRALSSRVDPGVQALDLGCGSGVLALAVAKLGGTARGVDNEVAAIADARRNAETNGLSARVRFDTTPIDDLDEPSPLILANLHAELIVRFAPSMLRLATKHIVLAGILADRLHLVEPCFQVLTLEDKQVDGEWVCLVYRAD